MELRTEVKVEVFNYLERGPPLNVHLYHQCILLAENWKFSPG